MVRKNLLKDLMDAPVAPGPRTGAKTARPQGTGAMGGPLGGPAGGQKGGAIGGAIGAVSQGIAELRARAVIELDPNAVRAGGLEDRLDHDPVDHAKLVAQIGEHGQQVPVLVRPDPGGEDGVYQIVYGRRRLAACRELGIAVKALVRELDDQALLLAQGQENTARRDLSFIEKAHFARQMAGAGLKRKVICDALSVDKTEMSRMFSVVEAIPEAVIRAIGAAPAAGRPRWQKLAGLIAASGTGPDRLAELARGASSDARFDALFRALSAVAAKAQDTAQKKAKAPAKADPLPDGAGRGMMLTAAGARIGRVYEGPEHLVLTLEDPDGFGNWLAWALPELYLAWTEGTGEDKRRLARAAAQRLAAKKD